MKTSSFLVLSCAAVLSIHLCQAAPQMRDAATHGDLSKKFSKVVSQRTQSLDELTAIQQHTEASTPKSKSLDELCEYLSFMGNTTLVAKKSLVAIPAKYRDRIKFVQGNNMLSFPDFFIKNRGWLTSLELSRAQAEGREPLDEQITEKLAKSSMVVIATHRNIPVGVLPYQGEQTEE